MVTWIVLGAVLLGLLVLALAARSVLVRLGPLRRAVLTLLRRQEQAQALQEKVLSLQERVLEVQGRAELAQKSVEVIRARRRAG